MGVKESQKILPSTLEAVPVEHLGIVLFMKIGECDFHQESFLQRYRRRETNASADNFPLIAKSTADFWKELSTAAPPCHCVFLQLVST